jgi:DNA polymerase I-like protein with 3'-5' exonuclease and polymerase domains
MVKIEKNLRKSFPDSDKTRGAHLVMQLHDELIYEVNQFDLKQVEKIVKDCMENCFEFPVRMKIKMRIGQNWGNLDVA